MKRSLRLLAIAILITFISVTFVNADFKGGRTYQLKSGDRINNNLYAAGRDVNIEGNVNGDVFIAGDSLLVTGDISKDLFAAGTNLIISGNTGEDMRLAGADITLSGRMNGDLLAAGAKIKITSAAEMKGSAKLAGETVIINGKFDGPMEIYSNNVEINGTVIGNLKVRSDSQINIGENAVINGNFEYSSPKEAMISPTAKISGQTQYVKKDKVFNFNRKAGKNVVWGAISGFWLFHLITSLLMALLMLVIFKKSINSFAAYSITNFWKQTLIGFILMILLPITFIVLFFTIIGIPLAGLGSLMLFASLILSGILADIFLGGLIGKLLSKNKELKINWWTILVAIIIFQIAYLIPVIGWIFVFIFKLAAFGAIWNLIYQKTVRAN